jgi:hypothetical protein
MFIGFLMAVVSLAGVTESSQDSGDRRKNSLPEVFALGSSSMSKVLYELGPADSAYLAGADGEGRGELSDDIALSYRRTLMIAGKEREAELTYFFTQATGTLSEVVISFPDSSEGNSAVISQQDAVVHFGSDYRLVRHFLVSDDSDLEAELSKCDSPSGEIPSLLYASLGLQVALAGDSSAKRVLFLRFANSILVGEERFPACPPDLRK